MPTLQIITTTTTNPLKMWWYTQVLSFSLYLSLSDAFTYCLCCIWVVVVSNDDEEEKLRFISYVYIHIYIWTHMGMQKQIDLASCASLYVYLSSTEQPSLAIKLVVRYHFSPPTDIFSFFSFLLCTVRTSDILEAERT
jgi:hypothetical protein